MSTFRIAGVIPARLSSTRLSRKVLRVIAGRPMVEWVWRAASASGLMDPVVVATDSDEVAGVCRERGIPVAMTSPDLSQRLGSGEGSSPPDRCRHICQHPGR
jgi:3-deoxy-manno-octulosonate cytidylyltransferase (CMP-KDO synthetase)